MDAHAHTLPGRQLDDCNRMFSALEAEALAYQLNQEGKKGDSYNFGKR